METCPNCHRKLISHASARCNWCGQVIEDPQYQAEATANREVFLTEQALHDAQRLAWQRNIPGMGPFGDPIFGLPVDPRFGVPVNPMVTERMAADAAQTAANRARRMAPPASEESQPRNSDVESETDRFRHLELE